MKINYHDQQLNHFYQQIGKLFYSVAAADRHATEGEIQALKMILRDEWAPICHDVLMDKNDGVKKIETVIDFLISNKSKADIGITEFKSFLMAHPFFFTQEIKELIINTAERVATTSSGKNKSELVILSILQSALSV